MKLRNKKTGEIVDFKIIADYDDCTSGWRLEKQDGSVLFYDHIDEINKDWEDYKPAEPLIKDEKIRKAVRAWAEVNSIKNVLYAERSDRSLYALTDMGDDDFSIELVGWIPTLKDGGVYTIAELCGEEEECGN